MRHGARSPAKNSYCWLNQTWDIGTAQLTDSGERQHYLNGVKLRKMYVDDAKFLPETFDPKYFYIRSTDFNRTIMSALAQIQGLYPLGTGPKFETSEQKHAAVPPFAITETAAGVINSDDVLPSRPTIVPIHVYSKKHEFLLRAYDNTVCPGVKKYKIKGKAELNEQTKEEFWPLYQEFHQKFAVPEDKLDVKSIHPYIDSYDVSKFDARTFDNDLSPESQKLVAKSLNSYFYDGVFAYEKVARISTSTLMQFLSSNIRGKISAFNGDSSASEFHKNVKFILLSAHDTLSAALISVFGLSHTQTKAIPLASIFLIEVYKKNGSFFVSWKYNGELLKISSNCNQQGD